MLSSASTSIPQHHQAQKKKKRGRTESQTEQKDTSKEKENEKLVRAEEQEASTPAAQTANAPKNLLGKIRVITRRRLSVLMKIASRRRGARGPLDCSGAS